MPGPHAAQRQSPISIAALLLTFFLLAATFFMISPPSGQTFPGAREWAAGSVLHAIVNLMSLEGAVATARGVEIKTLAFHVAAVGGLVLFAAAAARARRGAFVRTDVNQMWFSAQALLAGWAALSLASVFWSTDADIAQGQAALYLLALAWTLSLAWTLDIRNVSHLLHGIVVLSAVMAVLCVWYFYERNPIHRPGFPIGNPSTVAACALPGLIVAGFGLVAGIRQIASGQQTSNARVVLYGIALIPLTWCLLLTASRGALGGLAVGLSLAGVACAGPRARRWLMPVVVVLLIVGAIGVYRWSLGAGLGRSDSMRFRFYAWEYAARMWWTRPFTGHGAGAFTRFAGELSQRDATLDRAAFVGDWLDHAHNELFEILAEIGLVGGVTYVGGLIAIIFAGLYLWRAQSAALPGWMRLALVAAVAALIGDAMVGVGMRLEGVQAVFYTLVGALLAAARGVTREQTPPATADLLAAMTTPGDRSAAPAASFVLRASLAAGAIALAVVCSTLTMQNWIGSLAEVQINEALAANRPEDALQAAELAEESVLTPFRKLSAGERAMQARYAIAVRAAQRVLADENREHTSGSAPSSSPVRSLALDAVRQAYDAALALDLRAAGFGRALSMQARCAEILAALYADSEPALSAEWRRRAQSAWLLQRQRNDTDSEALLALVRYPATPTERAQLLQRALRDGFPSDAWRVRFADCARQPGFEEGVATVVRAAAPFDPQTNLDSIIVAAAPEAFRLGAYWHAATGNYAAAARECARAAELYEPMRPRFPELQSVALAEQADNLLRAGMTNAAQAELLLVDALNRLPNVSANKADEMRRPYLIHLALAGLIAGRDEAWVRSNFGEDAPPSTVMADYYVEIALMYVRDEAAAAKTSAWLQRATELDGRNFKAWSWRAWLAARSGKMEELTTILRGAATAGIADAEIERIKASLCKEFPATCETVK